MPRRLILILALVCPLGAQPCAEGFGYTGQLCEECQPGTYMSYVNLTVNVSYLIGCRFCPAGEYSGAGASSCSRWVGVFLELVPFLGRFKGTLTRGPPRLLGLIKKTSPCLGCLKGKPETRTLGT